MVLESLIWISSRGADSNSSALTIEDRETTVAFRNGVMRQTILPFLIATTGTRKDQAVSSAATKNIARAARPESEPKSRVTNSSNIESITRRGPTPNSLLRIAVNGRPICGFLPIAIFTLPDFVSNCGRGLLEELTLDYSPIIERYLTSERCKRVGNKRLDRLDAVVIVLSIDSGILCSPQHSAV